MYISGLNIKNNFNNFNLSFFSFGSKKIYNNGDKFSLSETNNTDKVNNTKKMPQNNPKTEGKQDIDAGAKLLKLFQKYQTDTFNIVSSQLYNPQKVVSLTKLSKQIKKELSKYDENIKEYQMIKKLLAAIDNNIVKFSTPKSQNSETALKKRFIPHDAPNIAWFEEKDFEKKLCTTERIFLSPTYYLDDKSKAIIKEATEKLKKAFPEDCVIWISGYEWQRTNDNNKIQYTVKGKFYECNDGVKMGKFSTNKLFTIKFVSDEKDTYKNFIDALISNRDIIRK